MSQSQPLSSNIPFAAIGRPACPKCKAPMMLVSIGLEGPGVDCTRLNVLSAIAHLRPLPRMETP
jgi:hypothetical protein